MPTEKKWTVQESVKFYNIHRWGDGYYSANNKGHVTVLPHKKKNGPTIDIQEVIKEIEGQGIRFPVVVRFHDILRHQVQTLNKTFRQVIKKAHYDGQYFGVYPVKVNQMREVVDEIIDAGGPFNYGLEAGSKAELLAVLGMNSNKDALTVLNGFKDKDYLRLALLGRKLGRKVIIVVEKFTELIDTLALAEEMNIDPMIGLRVKLSAKGTGKWASSGGERAKFGLSVPEVLQAVQLLKRKGKTKYAKLMHFHIGSQITDILTIKDAISEAARIYAQLVKLGLPLEYFDVGGGLGVDYDGSRSTADSSTNYSLTEYVEDIVYILKEICLAENIDHPNIVSESGRAVTARHSCVIAKVFDKICAAHVEYPVKKKAKEHVLVTGMRQLLADLTSENYQEIYNDAIQRKTDCINAFKLGVVTLDERAVAETLYWQICMILKDILPSSEFVPDELKGMNDYLAFQYLCNDSFFQSAPDSWAIGQVFPVIPLLRLDEEPKSYCTLSDITCDSDGKIDTFISSLPGKKSLKLHQLKKNEDYYIGIFMTGAYQDVMGDQHNLFGKLNEVHIFCDDEDPSDFYIDEVILGHTCAEVLAEMQYNPMAMAATVKRSIDQQVKKGKIQPKEGVKLADFYEDCLKSYTYLNK